MTRPEKHRENPYGDEVVAGIERYGLDRETTLVLGGGAMALAGIRAANDLDVMVPHFVFRDLQRMKTLGGVRLWLKPNTTRPFLETVPALRPNDVLHLDITHPHDPVTHDGSADLDDDFLRHIQDASHYQGVRYLDLAEVAQQKSSERGIGRRKDRRDIRAIERHLRATGE